jgi:hypothetical protein
MLVAVRVDIAGALCIFLLHVLVLVVLNGLLPG